jgi:hypothetical protein
MEAFHTQTPVEAPISCTAFLAIRIDPPRLGVTLADKVTKGGNNGQRERRTESRSAQEAIATAAKANVDALAEVISSAATAFMDALLKPSPKSVFLKLRAPRPGLLFWKQAIS